MFKQAWVLFIIISLQTASAWAVPLDLSNCSSYFTRKVESDDLTPIFNEVQKSYVMGEEFQKLQAEVKVLKQIPAPAVFQVNQMKKIEGKIESLQNEIAKANDRFIENLNELYSKSGITSQVQKDETGHLILELDFTNPPGDKNAVIFYQRVKARFGIDKVTVSLKDNVVGSSGGFFNGELKRMELGPVQGLKLLDDYVVSVGKHESRHAMFFAMWTRGDASLFHTSFSTTPGGRLLNLVKKYDQSMGVEELYTYSTDLQTYAQIFAGKEVENINLRKSLIKQIVEKNKTLKVVADTSDEVSGGLVLTLQRMIKDVDAPPVKVVTLPNGVLRMGIKDDEGRVAYIDFVSDEEIKIFDPMGQADKNFNQKLAQFRDKSEKGLALEELTTKFQATAEGRELAQDLRTASRPALELALVRLQSIQSLGKIQASETIKLEAMLKAYSHPITGGTPEQLQSVRQQMFKMSKNVKEGYKGFALRVAPAQ